MARPKALLVSLPAESVIDVTAVRAVTKGRLGRTLAELSALALFEALIRLGPLDPDRRRWS